MENIKLVEKNGINEIYDGKDDLLLFDGECTKGKKSGKGKEYNEKLNFKFEGEYKNGKKNGKGKHYIY